ncbi:MAG: nucleotidyl transferase AbiEii/AbiGii toxin family protein [Microgenomates group bacterium]
MNREDFSPQWGIFSKTQGSLIFKLGPLKNFCYLAGGTALALYLGHRTSLDFDFYTSKEFSRSEILDLLKKISDEKNITISSLENNNFVGVIDKVNVSIFHYPYKLLGELVNLRHISLASLEDIAAMKIVAVIQRPAKRDYIDIFYLLKRYSLERILDWAGKKYPNFNPYLALRALSFFDDVEDEKIEERGIKILDKNFSWGKAKKEIFEEVRKYQLSMFKK